MEKPLDLDGLRLVLRVAEICEMNIVVDEDMPQDEVWFEQDGKILGKIKVQG